MRRLLHPLNTPTKRVAGLVLLVAVLWLLAGLLVEGVDASSSRFWRSSEHALDAWWSSLFGGEWDREEYWFLRWATIASLLALAFSYGYDRAVQPLVTWVRG